MLRVVSDFVSSFENGEKLLLSSSFYSLGLDDCVVLLFISLACILKGSPIELEIWVVSYSEWYLTMGEWSGMVVSSSHWANSLGSEDQVTFMISAFFLEGLSCWLESPWSLK